MPSRRLLYGSYSTNRVHTQIHKRDRKRCWGLMELRPLNQIPVGVLTKNRGCGDVHGAELITQYSIREVKRNDARI